MFRKFSPSTDVSSRSLLKSSVQRNIRSKIVERYPGLADHIDQLLPKKGGDLQALKCKDHVQLLAVGNHVLFFNQHDGPWFPTLKLLHQYPDIMPKVQVDQGAIKFVLSGANIMCPGVTSPGGSLPEDLENEQIVAIMAEGKNHAVAIGQMKMSASDIKRINKGIGIESIHYLGDPLWRYQYES